MKRAKDKRSTRSAVLVLTVAAALAVLAFIYLFIEKGERFAGRPSREPANTQEAIDAGKTVNRLDKENIYTPESIMPAETYMPENTPQPKLTEREQIPAAPSVDPIIEGQME